MMKRITIAAALCLAASANAQQYPTKLVRIINAQGPGTVDVISRAYAGILSKAWGQPVVVEQKAGAGSILGAELVSHAEPDGHTILVSSSAAYIVNEWVTKNMPYNPGRDLAPVFGMAISLPVIAISNKLQVNNVQDLVAMAKANPGKLSFASAGIGSATHLQQEIIWKEIGGLKMLHVPYKGIADVARAVTAGEVDLGMPAGALVVGAVKKGQARILAVVGDRRDPDFPDAPTLKESGFPNSSGSIVWFGFAAPIKTPKPVIDKIAAGLAEASKDPEVIGLLQKANFQTWFTGPEEFGKTIANGRAAVGRVIQELGIQPQ